MDYRRPFVYLFDRASGIKNLLISAVCALVPMVGMIVLLGYQVEIIQTLQREGDDKRYPDFDLNRLLEYLLAGLRLFVLSLVASLVLLPVYLVLFLGFNLAAFAFANDEGGGLLFTVLLVLGVVVLFLASLALMVLIVPLHIRAALVEDWAKLFSFAFLRDFMSRVWKETIVMLLVIVVASIPLSLIGLLLCFVGVYVAGALLILAQAHLFQQLYALYLKRGGTPVPV